MDCVGFSIYEIISSASKFYLFLSYLDGFYFYVSSLWLELPRHPCLVSELRRKVFSVYVAFLKSAFTFPFLRSFPRQLTLCIISLPNMTFIYIYLLQYNCLHNFWFVLSDLAKGFQVYSLLPASL